MELGAMKVSHGLLVVQNLHQLAKHFSWQICQMIVLCV